LNIERLPPPLLFSLVCLCGCVRGRDNFIMASHMLQPVQISLSPNTIGWRITRSSLLCLSIACHHRPPCHAPRCWQLTAVDPIRTTYLCRCAWLWRRSPPVATPTSRPVQAFPSSIFRDKNRRDIGKSQSKWTANDGNAWRTASSARSSGPSHGGLATAVRQAMGSVVSSPGGRQAPVITHPGQARTSHPPSTTPPGAGGARRG
jgi:hypothetical protein